VAKRSSSIVIHTTITDKGSDIRLNNRLLCCQRGGEKIIKGQRAPGGGEPGQGVQERKESKGKLSTRRELKETPVSTEKEDKRARIWENKTKGRGKRKLNQRGGIRDRNQKGEG